MRVLLLHFWREKMHQTEVSPAPAGMHPALRPALLLPRCLQLHPWVPILSIRGMIIRILDSVSSSASFSFLFFFFYLFKISIRRHWRRSRGMVSKMNKILFIYFLFFEDESLLCKVFLSDIKYLIINKIFYNLQIRKILRRFWSKIDSNKYILIVMKYIEENINK